MVKKIEGARMTCANCSTNLICRLKEYTGDFKSGLQWQNPDGTAHYHTKDGKNFTCNIPDKVEDQQDTLDINTNTASDTSDTVSVTFEDCAIVDSVPPPQPSITMESLENKLTIVEGMCQAILQIVTEIKQRGKNE